MSAHGHNMADVGIQPATSGSEVGGSTTDLSLHCLHFLHLQLLTAQHCKNLANLWYHGDCGAVQSLFIQHTLRKQADAIYSNFSRHF